MTAVEWLEEQMKDDRFLAAFEDEFKQAKEIEKQQGYSEKEVLLILETLWERLDIWYNHEEDTEFNTIEWFNECELKKK
jgi:hypothetical protein